MKIAPMFLCLLSSFLFPGGPRNASADDSKWSGSCTVSFTGESTLHDFAGTVSAKPFSVSVSGIDDPAKAKISVTVVVNAAAMNTDNKKRDVEMHKCMDVATYPEIVVELKDLPVSSTDPVMEGAMPKPTVIPFKMSLKGKTHELTAKVSDWSFQGDGVDCTVTFPVSLKASAIKPPSVLGVVKVKDEIQVVAKIHLTRN